MTPPLNGIHLKVYFFVIALQTLAERFRLDYVLQLKLGQYFSFN